MKTAVTISRVLLGVIFFVLGLNGFLFFIPAPPIGGDAGTFSEILVRTHYIYLTAGVQVVAGVLLLSNQFVRFALVMLAAMLANILVFHITMMPSGLPVPLIVAVLWFIVAYSQRAQFAILFARR